VSAQLERCSDVDCRQVLTELNDYVDGELSAELCVALETHLHECENCQIMLDTLHKTLYLVQHLDDAPQELPDDVEYRLFAVLELEEYLPENAIRR
jgi:predicted anti-sigma-YlaC factor YlaD